MRLIWPNYVLVFIMFVNSCRCALVPDVGGNKVFLFMYVFYTGYFVFLTANKIMAHWTRLERPPPLPEKSLDAFGSQA